MEEMYKEAKAIILKEIDRLPSDVAYFNSDLEPSIAYELGRKDGLRKAVMLLDEERNPDNRS